MHAFLIRSDEMKSPLLVFAWSAPQARALVSRHPPVLNYYSGGFYALRSKRCAKLDTYARLVGFARVANEEEHDEFANCLAWE